MKLIKRIQALEKKVAELEKIVQPRQYVSEDSNGICDLKYLFEGKKNHPEN